MLPSAPALFFPRLHCRAIAPGRAGCRARLAFSLVEVTLAIGVTAFCLLSLFGLLLVGLKTNQAATEQTMANTLLSAVIADLRATPRTFPAGQAVASQRFQIPIPANPVALSPAAHVFYLTGEGKHQAALQGDSRYRVAVQFLPSPGGNAKAATTAGLRISWPAAKADQNTRDSLVDSFIALDRN